MPIMQLAHPKGSRSRKSRPFHGRARKASKGCIYGTAVWSDTMSSSNVCWRTPMQMQVPMQMQMQISPAPKDEEIQRRKSSRMTLDICRASFVSS